MGGASRTATALGRLKHGPGRGRWRVQGYAAIVPSMANTDITSPAPVTLTDTPDYYSEHYTYRRFPARIAGRNGIVRAGTFCVWARDVERPNPEHVTWSPELACIVAREYQTPEWHAERAERAERPLVEVGQQVRLGDVVITVPERARENVDSVPCPVLDVGAMAVELHSAWLQAMALVDGTDAADRAEADAYEALIDHVEASGLNYSAHDPRL